MTQTVQTVSDVDGAHRIFVSYMDKTREFYRAQGYASPYRYAYFDEVPFTPLSRPLSECRITLITTATEFTSEDEQEGGTRPPKRVFSGSTAEPPERLYTADLGWDKGATHTDDLDSFFPIHRLQELVQDGRIGSLAPRFHGAPTEYSQRRTIEQDAPEILSRCREDGVDVALLVPL